MDFLLARNTNENETETSEAPGKLISRWTFWHIDKFKSKNWEQNLAKVGVTTTWDEVQGLIDVLPLPSQMSHGEDVCVFKSGIEPKWEDPANLNGGRWIVIFKVYPINNETGEHDIAWVETLRLVMAKEEGGLMDLVGPMRLVNGVVLNRRGRDLVKISIWLRDPVIGHLETLEVGRRIKRELGLADGELRYEQHSANKKRNSRAPAPALHIL